MIKSISLEHKEQWKSCFDNLQNKDFYYSFDYHKLSLEKGEIAELLVYETESTLILFPIVKRPISSEQYPGYYDITSVYGYAGPIMDKIPDNETIVNFQQELSTYFEENKIVAAFSRLHPSFSEIQNQLLNNFGELVNLGKTVYIDLTLSLEEQKRQYRKSNKSEINQLAKAGVEIKKAETEEEIQRFIEIYWDNMKRVSAKEYYYFPKEYFHEFLQSDEFESFVLLAYYENKIIAGAIFTISGNIMQYHLAGTDEHHLKFTPMKLILDKARLIANEKGLKVLHLGGGIGGSETDSLFLFKKGFSDYTYLFYIWKSIVNPEIYSNLVAEKGLENNSSSFFPLYRI